MAVFKYDDGTGTPETVEPKNGEFEYVSTGDYWSVKIETQGNEEVVKWIPNARIYSIEGRRSRIRKAGP